MVKTVHSESEEVAVHNQDPFSTKMTSKNILPNIPSATTKKKLIYLF